MRVSCTPAGQGAYHQNQKSRNVWGGETVDLPDRFIFYPRAAGTYTCTLSVRLDAHNANTNDTDHRATVQRFSGGEGTELNVLWPLSAPGVWGTESGPVDAGTINRDHHHQPFYLTVPEVPVSGKAGCTAISASVPH